jgi:hypothetical protein
MTRARHAGAFDAIAIGLIGACIFFSRSLRFVKKVVTGRGSCVLALMRSLPDCVRRFDNGWESTVVRLPAVAIIADQSFAC